MTSIVGREAPDFTLPSPQQGRDVEGPAGQERGSGVLPLGLDTRLNKPDSVIPSLDGSVCGIGRPGSGRECR